MKRLRNLRYFAKQKALQKEINKMSQMYLSLQTQARFPDSGYYYAGKERGLERIMEKISPLGECRGRGRKKGEYKVNPRRWKSLWNYLIAEGNKRAINYYDKVQIIDNEGRQWTASDMDAAMAMS